MSTVIDMKSSGKIAARFEYPKLLAPQKVPTQQPIVGLVFKSTGFPSNGGVREGSARRAVADRKNTSATSVQLG